MTNICVVEDCDEDAEALRYCLEHWSGLPDIIQSLVLAGETENRWEGIRVGFRIDIKIARKKLRNIKERVA